MNKLITALLTLAFTSAATSADMKLPAIFGDHMVLQRGMKAPIWGWADAGEKVTVEVGETKLSTEADANGKWRIELPAMEPAGPISIKISGKNSITLDDVLCGEVWLCSGQSNMSFRLSEASNAHEAIAAADHPTMRLFVVARADSDTPQENVTGGKWQVCTPATAAKFSAVGYFFGLNLQEKLNVPVGLIESDWGGTRAETWIPKETFDDLKLPYEPAWTKEISRMEDGKTAKYPVQSPAHLYNQMIHPIAGYALRGVIWYQGESNARHNAQYAQVLTSLIESWRAAWHEDFPFLIVQLANFKLAHGEATETKTVGGGWPELRAAQAQVAATLPKCGLAVAIDIGDPTTVHPTNKAEVGRRLSLTARKVAYNESIESAGPTFKSLKIDGKNAVVTFDHADGLKNKGDKIQGFEIAGDDGNFVSADAKIDGTNVIVSAESVAAPKSVRYGWNDYPICTLYNTVDLPAVPFETK